MMATACTASGLPAESSVAAAADAPRAAVIAFVAFAPAITTASPEPPPPRA